MESSGPPVPSSVWNVASWRSMYPGMWSWVVQRLSAVVLLILFPFHVLNPYIAWLRLAVLALVILHGMHGLKVILTDFGFPARYQRRLLWALAAVGVAAFFALGFLRRAFWGFI